MRAIVDRSLALRDAVGAATAGGDHDGARGLQDKRLALVFLLDNVLVVS